MVKQPAKEFFKGGFCMTKYKICLLIMTLVILLSACGKGEVLSDETALSNDSVVSGAGESDPSASKVLIKASKLTEEMAQYTEVSSYVGDVDRDGVDERVVLSTAAQRDSKGEFLWNDGQNWALYIEDRENVFILLDEYIQAGNVYFDVSDYYMKDGAVPKIGAIITTGAGFFINNYTFLSEEKAYVREVVYDTQSVTEGGINRRFSSVPAINK